MTHIDDLSYITSDLRPLARPISELIPDPDNARKHSPRNIEVIRASLAEFKQTKPVVVQRCPSGLVVRAGNGTLEAAKALGWTHIAAVVEDSWDDVKASMYALADNRTAELAEWDFPVLGVQLMALKDNGLDISFLGFDEIHLSQDENFSPGSLDDQGQLDEKSPTICPACGHSFVK